MISLMKKNMPLVPYKWELIIWLWLVHFINQADRQIFNVLLPLVKADMQLTDVQLGLIATAFTLCVGLCIPVAGFVGDLYQRKFIIIISMVVWSTATIFTGASSMLWHLILFRCVGVGGGEAFYAPAANAYISERHRKTRALAISIHQTALYAGIVLSGILGGLIGETYGWRSAFYVFGVIGLILSGVLYFRLAPSERGSLGKGVGKVQFIRDAALLFFKTPSAILLGGAFMCLVYVNVGFLTWMPTYMHEQFGQSIAEAGFSSTFYHHISAFFGILLGGVFSDKLALRSKNSRLIIQSTALFLGSPFIFLMTTSSELWQTYFCLAGFGFFRGLYEANFITSLYEVIHSRFHASVIGVLYLFVFSVGSLSPLVLGYFKATVGLAAGLSWMSFAYIAGAIFILLTLFFFIERDREKAKISFPSF